MPGNLPNFDRYDVLRCFLRIRSNISRALLTQELGLGEGTMRSILDTLKNRKLISSNRQGHSLTAIGKKLRHRLDSLMDSLSMDSNRVYPGREKYAFLLKLSRHARVGYEQRDIAVRHGADAALIMHYDDGLVMPDVTGFDTGPFEVLFSFRKNNILVVTVADDRIKAERSGLAVCESLSPEIGKALNRIC